MPSNAAQNDLYIRRINNVIGYVIFFAIGCRAVVINPQIFRAWKYIADNRPKWDGKNMT